MGFTKFTKNVLNVSALPDRVQNQASSLKLVFDQAGVDIKAALNALISELEAKVAAANIGADVASVTEKNVQGILTAFENEIANRYTKAETNNAILADTNELIADVKIDLATGLLTVTKKNGTKQTFETSTEAESYAVGGTGTRPGEDTDNAKYYAQIAKQVAGGDFVTVVEMEGYAQKKGLYPNYNETELKGEVIETETTLEAESVLKVHGNSTQETRSGKNLFDKTACVDGFATGASGDLYSSGIYSVSDFTEVQPHIKYTLSNFAWANFYNADKVGISQFSNSTPTFTVPENVRYIRVTLLTTDKGICQLEEGSTATSYETYGASPSPEFESPIMSVKSKSDNLFDMDATPLKNSDTTVETNNNTIKVVATTTKQNTASYFSIPNNESLLGETITFSTEIKESSQNLGRAILAFLDSGNNWISNIARLNSGEKSITVTVPSEFVSNATKIGVLLYTNTNGTSQVGDYVTYTNIMLNKGSVALPYQPYGYVPAEAKVEGKNLLNIKEGYVNSATRTYKDDSLTLTSTLETGGYSTFYTFVKAKPNASYYIQCKSTRTGNGGGGIVVTPLFHKYSNALSIAFLALVPVVIAVLSLIPPSAAPVAAILARYLSSASANPLVVSSANASIKPSLDCALSMLSTP